MERFDDLKLEYFITIFPFKPRFLVNKKHVIKSIFFITKYINFGRLSLNILSILIHVTLKTFLSSDNLRTPIVFISTNGSRHVNILIDPPTQSVFKAVDYQDLSLVQKKYKLKQDLKKSIFSNFCPTLYSVEISGTVLETHEEFVKFKRTWKKSILIEKMLLFFNVYFQYVEQTASRGENTFITHGDLAYWNVGLDEKDNLKIFDFDEVCYTEDYCKDFVYFFISLPLNSDRKKIFIKKFILSLPIIIGGRLENACRYANLL